MPRIESRDVPDNAYFDGRIADRAIGTLEEIHDQPFFLAVGFWKPHLPFNAPRKYWDQYRFDGVETPTNSHPPRNVPPIALHDSRELLRSFPSGLTEQQMRRLRHGYYAAISFVDAQIGRVLSELDRLKLRNRTIVVLWSDHGFHLGEHDLWCKTSNFELDARVPLIISTPGQTTAGTTTSSLVELLDLYPTLAELCDLNPPANLEGKSLRPLLEDPGATVRSAALTQHPRPAYPPGETQPDVMGYSIRTDRYRYTEWRRLDGGELVGRELYDHHTDSGESNNRAGDVKMATVLEQHGKILAELTDRPTSEAIGGSRSR